MALSNAIKVHILDPTVFNTRRCEFRLDDTFYSSSLKLVDVGVYSSSVDGANTGLYYPSVNGVLASIKSLTLFSGATVLDQVQELASYGAIKNLMVTNQGSEDINRFQLLNGINLAIKAGGKSLTAQASNKDYVQHYAFPAGDGNAREMRHNNQTQITGQAEDGASGYIVLSDYLEMLKTIPVLPMIPDLRLVIEWNTDAADFLNDEHAPTNPANPVYIPIRPQLMAEEILGQKPATGVVKMPFVSTIVERFAVPEAADTVTKVSSFRSGAFRSHYVKDLIFYNKVASADSWMLRNCRSPAQKNEKIQLVLNGVKYLPDQGCDNEAAKMQYFNQTLGGLNVPLAAAMSSMYDKVGDKFTVLDDLTAPLAHNVSVGAFAINTTIDRLDIEYQRQGSTVETDQTGGFELLVFGHVAKLLEMQDGKIRISY